MVFGSLVMSVVTTDLEKWTPEHVAEFEEDEWRRSSNLLPSVWAVEKLRRFMVEAGNEFIKANQDLFEEELY